MKDSVCGHGQKIISKFTPTFQNFGFHSLKQLSSSLELTK